jgi:hypothetical protein
MTSINDFATTYMCQALPFGGVKDSGFDRFAGVEGLRGLCVAKAVCEDRCGCACSDCKCLERRCPCRRRPCCPARSGLRQAAEGQRSGRASGAGRAGRTRTRSWRWRGVG